MSKKKKVFATSAAAVLAASAVTPAVTFAAEKTFPDVKDDAWYADAVNALLESGVIQGDQNGNFNPDKELTRAEGAEFLYKALGLSAEGTEDYPDVEEDHWFYDAVVATTAAGIFEGNDAGEFMPKDELDRQQAAVALVRAFGLEGSADLSFEDADDIASWAKDAVAAAVENGVIEGKPGNKFAPTDTITRAEFAVMVKRAMDAVAAPEVVSASAINPNTIKVAISGKLEEVSKENFTVVNSKTSAKQYIKSAVLSEDGKTVTIEFYNNLTDETIYTVNADFNGETSSVEFEYVIGEVAQIVAESATIPAGVATDIEYTVYDENGLDITSLTSVTVKSTAGTVNGTKITLNDGEIAFVEVEATKSDGTVVKSNRVTLKGSDALSSELVTFTIENEEPTKADFEAEDFEPVQSIKLGETDKELYLHTIDQYGNYVDLEYNGDVEFESLNKEVLLVDANTGALTPRKAGTADVSIKVGAIETVVTVTVLEEAEVSAIELDKTEINVSEAVTTPQSVTVTLLDQYGDVFTTAKTVKASVVSGSDYVTLDKTSASTVDGKVTFNLTAVENGTAVIKFVVDGTEIENTLTFNVQDAGEIAGYEVEGVKSTIDKYDDPDTDVDESMFKIDVYPVDAKGVKTGNALEKTDGSITIKDADGIEVDSYNGVGLNTIINAADFTAGGTYTLSVVVGNLEVYSTTFTVVDSTPKPTAEQINGTIEANGNIGEDLIDAIKDSFEITFDGQVMSDATLVDVTFVSDNTSVIDSGTDATSVKTIAEGSATIAVSEIEVDLDGDNSTTVDQYVIEVDALIDIVVEDKTAPTATVSESDTNSATTFVVKFDEDIETVTIDDASNVTENVTVTFDAANDATGATFSVANSGATNGENFTFTITDVAGNTTTYLATFNSNSTSWSIEVQ